eukprot:jgi/Tetstr1/425636/TSEL_016056.t1
MVLWRGGKAFQYTVDMRQAEFRAVAQALGLDASSIDFQNALASEPQGEGHFDEGGLQYVRGCSAQEAASIAAQCVLVRQIHEVLVSGDGLEECGSAAARFPFAAHAQTLGLAAGESWKVRQRDFRFKNRSRGRAPLDSATLRALGPATDQFAGDVDLRDPQRTLWLLRGDFSCEYGRPQRSAGSVCFSILLARGRDFHDYRLSQRHYLSTTTMDNETAFIMANLAGVVPGSRVCDPFCGSGGILLAAGALGASSAIGIDVDTTLEQDRIQGNFDQQSLSANVKLIHGDLADDDIIAEAVRANGGMPFDAVISDPPLIRWLVVMEKVGDGMEDECVLSNHGEMTMYRKRGDAVMERTVIGYDFDGIEGDRARLSSPEM